MMTTRDKGQTERQRLTGSKQTAADRQGQLGKQRGKQRDNGRQRQINRQRDRKRQRQNEIENKSHRTHSAGVIAVCSTCTGLHRFAALHALEASRGSREGAWGFGVG